MRILLASCLVVGLAGAAIAQQSNTPPIAGSNSFTEGQAQSRLTDRGYTQVSGLRKDNDGIWRGRAVKDGTPVNVWVDYKGNVGQEQ